LHPSSKDILRVGKSLVAVCVDYINIQFKDKIGLEVVQPSYKDINNITRGIDKWIHNYYHSELRREFGYDIVLLGEESRQKHIETKDEKKMIASIDAVDGTDLLSKGLHNWCTAIFFFVPGHRILASLVGVPSGAVYYASEGGAFKTEAIEGEIRTKELEIEKDQRPRMVRNASICFYGQKAGNFLSLMRRKPFVDLLEKLEQESSTNKPVPFRIYNLGGNSMMVKLIEGGVDAVIELKGQRLYDVVPGALIALKAGAFWGDLKGNSIDDEYLQSYLDDPNKRLSYILSSSKKLYDELLKYFKIECFSGS
jgi:fructose-1,6-bisphosphatase/inositol monophosphatase family enzyme